uniref:GTPase family protein n=1 Tax=Thaumasiovibrio occultus TaxID=1891184 RepID=UPI000B35D6D6|nr:GTPase domain-containing protein [Thaumasiovibrio occultus]
MKTTLLQRVLGGRLLLLLLWAVPVLLLMVAGGMWLWQNHYWLPFAAVFTVVTLLGWGLGYWQRRQRDEEVTHQAVSAAAKGWGEREQAVWQRQMTMLDAMSEPEWSQIYTLSLENFKQVAVQFHPENPDAVYAFTLPEMLQINEEVSRRYRRYVDQHIPMVQHMRLDRLKRVYKNKSRLETGWRWANNTYRVARWVNPASALLGELRGAVIGSLFDEASAQVQYMAKRLLLEQSCAVAIDLYSGHWQLAPAASPELAEQTLPATVTLIGQTNAGKSSLINQLVRYSAAEADALPATAKAVGYRFDYPDGEAVLLQDSPGMRGAEVSTTLELVKASDIVIWVVKATQPGRQLDVTFARRIADFYQQHPERRRAPVVVAITHIDQLGPAAALETLNFAEPKDAKSQHVAELIGYLKQQLPLPEETIWVPLCVSEQDAFNIDVLEDAVFVSLDEAEHVQHNRRRHQKNRVNLKQEWQRTLKLGKVIAKQFLPSSKE